jgi:hypothetical protein
MFFTIVVTIGCNIFNNVPFVLLLGLACGDPFYPLDPDSVSQDLLHI